MKVQLTGAYILQEYIYIKYLQLDGYRYRSTSREPPNGVKITRLQTQAKLQATAVSLALLMVLVSPMAQAAGQVPHDLPLPNSLCIHSRGLGTFSCGGSELMY